MWWSPNSNVNAKPAKHARTSASPNLRSGADGLIKITKAAILSKIQELTMSSRDPRGIKEALSRRRTQGTIRQLANRPAGSADFSSNDFLSLTSNEALRKDYLNALQSYSADTFLGSGGSRLLDGNSVYAEQLERELTTFYNAAAGLLCNSGFDANVGIFSCLPQPGDVVIFDELIHASVHDGMKLSRAAMCISFKHNDVESLRAELQKLKQENEKVRGGQSNVLVAIETVYSMSGDVAPLADIVKAVQTVLDAGNGHLIVDEAHAVGVFGPEGRGIACQLGLEKQISVRLITFGKAIAAAGALILCNSAAVREYLINYARPLIYTTFMPFPLLVAIEASHSYLRQGKLEPLVFHLQLLQKELHRGLLAISASLSAPRAHLLRVPDAPSQSAISYVMSSQSRGLAAHCRSNGLWVRAIMPPTVPAGAERVRICMHAGNTVKEVEKLIRVVECWAHETRIAKL